MPEQLKENSVLPSKTEIEKLIFERLNRYPITTTATVTALQSHVVSSCCHNIEDTKIVKKFKILVFDTIKQMVNDGLLLIHIDDRDFSQCMVKAATPMDLLAKEPRF